MAMSPAREALALKAMQRIDEPRPKPAPKPTPKNDALERQQARLATVDAKTRTRDVGRVVTLACTHKMRVGTGDKRWERLWCTRCGGWQVVTEQ